MTEVDKRSVDIREEDAAFVDRLVSSGAYDSAEDVISAGISALRDHEADFERWLREKVVPVAREMEAHPERGIPAAEVFAELRRRHELRLKRY